MKRRDYGDWYERCYLPWVNTMPYQVRGELLADAENAYRRKLERDRQVAVEALEAAEDRVIENSPEMVEQRRLNILRMARMYREIHARKKAGASPNPTGQPTDSSDRDGASASPREQVPTPGNIHPINSPTLKPIADTLPTAIQVAGNPNARSHHTNHRPHGSTRKNCG